MKDVEQRVFTGERALFKGSDLRIFNSTFADGESALKESRNVELFGSMFKWKYPLWYGKHIRLTNCTLFDTARAGIWYTEDIAIKNTVIESPKNFRRCNGITLDTVYLPNSAETLWSCKNVNLKNVTANGDYFAMNGENLEIDGLTLTGNYAFDGAKNVTVRNSRLLSKDAFWNSENVTVYDSFIAGEYLGWNAKNLTLVGCIVESLQGMCYIENLVIKNCRLLNTTLAFEYSSVDAEIAGKIDSVFNPASGKIAADRIEEIIVQPDMVNPSSTEIICRERQNEQDCGDKKGERRCGQPAA